MNRILALLLTMLINQVAFANGGDWKVDQHKLETQKQQKMQERPSSTSIGGARSGALEFEKSRDEKYQKTIKKQKPLYESDGHYRYGL